MATRIRERSRVTPNCTRFNFSHADAFIDKVTAVVDIGEIPASNYLDVNAFFRLMALSSAYKRMGWGSSTGLISQSDDRLFNYSLSVRHLSSNHAVVQATVYYNPTRCFAYWGNALPDENSLESRMWATPKLKADQIRTSRDHNDNFIPRSKLALARNIRWDEYAKNVLRLVILKIQDDVYEISERGSITLYPERQWKWVVQSLEVYWEFGHADAVGVLRRMFANAQDKFVSGRERYFIQRGLSVVGSSYIYELWRKNTVCCAYAKLNNRIRLECRFNSNPRQIFGDELSLEHYPNHNLDFLRGFFHVLITKASRLMEPFSELDTAIFNEPQFNLEDMILLFSKLERLDVDAKHEVLSSLIDSGRVAVPPPKTPTAQIVRRLKTLELLAKGPHKRKQVPFYYPLGELARFTAGLRNVHTSNTE